MGKFLSDHEVNTGRLYNLDILKTLSIISMILCHTVMRFAMHRPGYKDEVSYIFGDAILGCFIGVAHAFMFAMGVGFIFSKKSTPVNLLKRGIIVYLMGYVLNLFRFVIYAGLDYIMHYNYSPDLFHAIFFQDIFQFAGLAMMFTALLKKLRANEIVIVSIGVVLSVIGSLIPDVQTGNLALDLILGTFVTASNVPSHFTFFHWYIFVAWNSGFDTLL